MSCIMNQNELIFIVRKVGRCETKTAVAKQRTGVWVQYLQFCWQVCKGPFVIIKRLCTQMAHLKSYFNNYKCAHFIQVVWFWLVWWLLFEPTGAPKYKKKMRCKSKLYFTKFRSGSKIHEEFLWEFLKGFFIFFIRISSWLFSVITLEHRAAIR